MLTSKAIHDLEDMLAASGMNVDRQRVRASMAAMAPFIACQSDPDYDECLSYPRGLGDTTLPLATLCAIYEINGT